ncbi:hypothetical protein NA56DRAFT_30215 [Hyaloscypha hepaticicola]|uniref:Uncharacterized protein n=1 Tax=Hyaloscypha hepaticicola TaxID=2082293 RepID=A0A2J6QD43_9HELO|nr:hypothetical protein NA56DRAFT_30215 [Hyaloscypha hepaticicola]
MADDSMEISSEIGHNDGDGDGDIDIDFDFTTAQVDEDYVIEDATLTADAGGDPGPQPSPAFGNDDLMIDEDVDSYSMGDADVLHGEEGHSIDHEALPLDIEGPFHAVEDPNLGLQFGANNLNSATDYMYAHQESLEVQVAGNDTPEGNSRDIHHQKDLQQEDLQPAEVAPIPDTENLAAEFSEHESRTASPVQGSPKSTVIAQGQKSPLAPSRKHESTSPDPTTEYHETNLTSQSVSGDGITTVKNTSLDETTVVPSHQEVMVVYQSVEYALFSSSELDDTDSFFLSDMSIAEKPLADLFKAIRQVIQEDLGDEDELCMAVEDLGIQAEESSALLHDVTLTQILNLREKLLRNDGVESSPPPRILLGTRINFSKRLQKLGAGAAGGKGLSQFIAWDEHSESLDDLEDVDASNNGIVPDLENPELQNASDAEHAEQGSDEHQATHGIEDHTPEELVRESEEEHEEPEAETTDDSQLAPTGLSSGDGSIQHATPDANQSSMKAAKENDYGEDDLIDYSEEEGDNLAAVQGHAKSPSNHENRTNQEYEAINEDLRRRSLSRTSDDKISQQSNKQEDPATEDDHRGALIENVLEYDEKNQDQDPFPNGILDGGYEDFTIGNFDPSESLEQYEGVDVLAHDFGGEGEFTDEGTFDVFGTDPQEYNYGEEGTTEDDGISRNIQQDQADVEVSFQGAEVMEDKPEHIDTAESSVTVDADEIQYEDEDEANGEGLDKSKSISEPQVGVEHEDEIGYEDEDEIDKEKRPEAATPLTPPPVLPSSNGKRPRTDGEPDDALNVRSKAKRPRS